MRVNQIPYLSIAAGLILPAVLFAGGCKSSTPTTPASDNAASQQAAPAPAGQPAPAPTATPSTAPDQGSAAAPGPAPAAAPAPAPMPPAEAAVPAPPPPPPEPIKLTAPAGAKVTVVVTQQLSAKNNNVGDPFTGELAAPLTTSSGKTVFPKGSPVQGTVTAAKGRGKFKGEGNLAIQVTSIRGHAVTTSDYLKQEKGKGKRSTAMIAGGGGGGALIGGLAGGGKGALIGGLVGAGAGTAVAATTGNKDIVIPAESVVSFTLQSPVSITVQPKENPGAERH